MIVIFRPRGHSQNHDGRNTSRLLFKACGLQPRPRTMWTQVTSRDLGLLSVLTVLLVLCRAPRVVLHFNKVSAITTEIETLLKNC